MVDSEEPSGLAWALFDAVVASAEARAVNPWNLGVEPASFRPDFTTLERLLGVPIFLGNVSQSGLLANAVDVWIAYELRRAGFDRNAVWPRATPPRVLPQSLSKFVAGIPQALRKEVVARYDRSGTSISESAAAPSSAYILGKNYVKQVDVVMSDWATGPELLISTKRMDNSYSNNALNRVEESYGDAKSLRLRHPLAAIGFVFVLNSAIYVKNGNLVPKIKDLLTKLGEEDDAYHAVMLIMPNYDEGKKATPAELEVLARDIVSDATTVANRVPKVDILLSESTGELAAARFFEKMIGRVLSNTPVDFHESARELLRH